MQRRGAMSQGLMIGLGLIVLGVVVVGVGVGLSSAIGSLFQKGGEIGFADNGSFGSITVSKILFVGDDVIKTAAGGYNTLADKEAGQPAIINDQMRSALSSISVTMDSVAIAGQPSQTTIDKGFAPAVAQTGHGFNGLVFMFSKNDTDANTTKQNIDKLVTQASGQGLITFGILLPTVGGDANYIKAVNQHLKSKEGSIQLIDATNLRPVNSADPTTIPIDKLRELIKGAISSWNTQASSGAGVYASGNVLPVPLYDQMTKWGNYPSGGKFCGVTSVKMALDYYLRLNYVGLKNTSELNDSYYKSHFVYGWRTSAAWYYYLRNGRQVVDRLDANNWRVVAEALSAGHPIVSYGSWTTGGGHIVVIIGIGPNSITYADPIHAKVKTVSKAKASNYLTATKYSYAGTAQYLIDSTYKTNRLR